VITLEEKLDLFKKLVYQRIAHESEMAVRNVEEENDQKMIVYTQQLEQEAEMLYKEAEKKIDSRRNEMLSVTHMKNKQKMLEKKQALMDGLLQEVRREVALFTTGKQYAAYIKWASEQTLGKVAPGERIYIYMTSQDISSFTDVVADVAVKCGHNRESLQFESIDPTIIGGLIVENKSHTLRMNLTLKSTLEDEREWMMKRIYKALEEVGVASE
jgi:V/A-type H+-transporting ATPase subunit E